MKRGSGSPTYAIAAVSKLTGISCHALRVWERRHGFPRPERTDSGHRRYAAEQVNLLRWVAAGLNEGRELSNLMDEVRTLSGEAPGERVSVRTPERTPAEELVDALLAGEVDAAEAIHEREIPGLEPSVIVERLLEPAWVDAGDRLFRSLCDLDQERIAGEFLRRKLVVILDAVKRENSQPRGRVLLLTLVGDRHEGGMLMLAIYLELAGWRSMILGTEVPITTLLESVQRFAVSAVGVSFILSRNIRKRFAELSRVREVPVFVGGRSLLNYQSLARRHGLIPLPGPARNVVNSMIARIESPKAVGAFLKVQAERTKLT